MCSRRSRPTRRPGGLALLLGLGLVLSQVMVPLAARAAGGPRAVVAEARPNIVVVMADDMRVEELLFAPEVRRLVQDHGLTFDNAFSSYPLCCPARASFLTGLQAHNHQVYWHAKPYGYGAFDDSRTLATSLRAVGYHTGFVGKYLNRYGIDDSRVSGKPSYRYVPNGWERWVGSLENPGRDGIHGGTYNYFDTPYNVDGVVDNRYRGRYQTSVIGDFSVDAVRRFAPGDAPFFLYVNFVAPHFGGPREARDPGTWVRPDGVVEPYQTPATPAWVHGRFDERITRPAGLPKDGGPAEADMSDKPAWFRVLGPIGPEARRAMTSITRQRAEAVFVMDRAIRRIVAALKASGEWDNTWFVFVSDNGYFLGEHRRRQGKVFAHEPSLRVPLLITGPGARQPATRFDPVSMVDLTATIVDLAGAGPPRRKEGVSKVPTLLEGDQGWTVPVLTEATHTCSGPQVAWTGARTSIGVRTVRYSYTRYRDGQRELYDLKTDPLQLRSVHRDPAYAAVRRQLDEVWDTLKGCDGAGCRQPLPAELQASPEREQRLTRAYWRAVAAEYGW